MSANGYGPERAIMWTDPTATPSICLPQASAIVRTVWEVWVYTESTGLPCVTPTILILRRRGAGITRTTTFMLKPVPVVTEVVSAWCRTDEVCMQGMIKSRRLLCGSFGFKKSTLDLPQKNVHTDILFCTWYNTPQYLDQWLK